MVTPTWNEEESVEQHLRDIFRELPGISVLVVDDSSTDRTPAIVNALRSEFARLHLIERKGPRNFVRSYCEGLGWGVERGYEALVSMDADRSHPAEAIEALLEAVEVPPGSQRAKLASATRPSIGSRQPLCAFPHDRALHRHDQRLLSLPGFASQRRPAEQPLLLGLCLSDRDEVSRLAGRSDSS